ARAASSAAGARSKPVTVWPAFTRLAAIGPPMWPRPRKAILVMMRSCSLRIRRKPQLAVAERREVPLDLGSGDPGEGLRPPVRGAVLVDELRSDALHELGARE